MGSLIHFFKDSQGTDENKNEYRPMNLTFIKYIVVCLLLDQTKLYYVWNKKLSICSLLTLWPHTDLQNFKDGYVVGIIVIGPSLWIELIYWQQNNIINMTDSHFVLTVLKCGIVSITYTSLTVFNDTSFSSSQLSNSM